MDLRAHTHSALAHWRHYGSKMHVFCSSNGNDRKLNEIIGKCCFFLVCFALLVNYELIVCLNWLINTLELLFILFSIN